MSFLDDIFASLEAVNDQIVVQEIRDGRTVSLSGRELLALVGKARAFLSTHGLSRGDRCALLAHNSIHWVITDLALLAEGVVVVPLYARQAPAELIAIMKDCSPALICCGETSLGEAIYRSWPESPAYVTFEQIFACHATAAGGEKLRSGDAVTIIYTSGTSGEAKGVVLNAGNIGFMLGCTSARLDLLMAQPHESGDPKPGQHNNVFHYLPFSFAGSWIMLLTCLLRGSRLTLNTDLTKLAAEMRAAEADYFMNVPALLERMRKAVDEQLWTTAGAALTIYSRAKGAWARKHAGESKLGDSLWLKLANSIVFPTIRKKMIGARLRALICGSAPLNIETQLFFHMLGIPVLQVYGLTETTGICTLDDPAHVVPGRVGPAIQGIEMNLGEDDEIIVRGPNIFPGYWNKPNETAKVLRDDWFHTGDQGEKDSDGNWKIIGRIKNLIILGSGHNVAPEPIEDKLLQQIPGAQQVVIVGNNRGYLSAIITGDVTPEKVQSGVDAANLQFPHYKQVRAFHIHSEPFTIENGMLTANGKMKRDVIAARLQSEIDSLYQARQAS
jgi:long-chain acyl-CoA synthetase